MARLVNHIWFRTLVLAAVVAPLAAVNSHPAGSLDPASHRSRLTIKEEPQDAQQILFVQKTMAAAQSKANPAETREVTVVGQIGGMPNVWPDLHPTFPWYEKQASFFVVDLGRHESVSGSPRRAGRGNGCRFDIERIGKARRCNPR